MSGAGQQPLRRKPSVGSKDQTRLRIEKMEAEREERRRAMAQRKEQRAAEEKANLEAGNPGDVDFIGMVRSWREEHAHQARPIVDHNQEDGWYPNLCICVRKRPTNAKEQVKKDHDSVTVLNPTVTIHSAKLRVDGISKYLDHQAFQLDYAFDEICETIDIYRTTARPLLEFACQGTGGRATIFAYGQTGSGKTHTMSGIQRYLVQDLFQLLQQYDDAEFGDDENICTLNNCRVVISFFEMYGGNIQDLLNERHRLKVLEDGKGEVIITGLQERLADTPEVLMALLEEGNHARTTHTTEANDESSRSHSICQIMLRDLRTDKMRGKLSLVDLAGSERGADTKSHNAQRRAESADINTSLLALKECIRALDRRGNASNSGAGTAACKETHVPYRGSKLTLILKDCFTSPNAMTTMIATVSPGASSTDHSLNTLRYADRIKEQKVGGNKRPSAIGAHTGMIRLKRRLHVDPSSPPRAQKPHSHTMEETDDGLEVYKTLCSEEEELQHTVETLLEQEEEILGLHMAHIAENAELLSEEGKMLQRIQYDAQPQDMDKYIDALEHVLDRKELMILNLQEQLAAFRANIHLEQDLRSRVMRAS